MVINDLTSDPFVCKVGGNILIIQIVEEDSDQKQSLKHMLREDINYDQLHIPYMLKYNIL